MNAQNSDENIHGELQENHINQAGTEPSRVKTSTYGWIPFTFFFLLVALYFGIAIFHGYNWTILHVIIWVIATLAIPVYLLILSASSKKQQGINIYRVMGLLLLIPCLAVLMFALSFCNLNWSAPPIAMVIPLLLIPIYPFVLFVSALFIKDRQVKRIAAMIAIFSFLYLLFIACFLPSVLNSPRAAFEFRCKLTLRSLGTAQFAFADDPDNPLDNYGTWDELVTAEYIQSGYTKENIIDFYTVELFDAKPAVLDEFGDIIERSSFTIVAIPMHDPAQRYGLRTFAISDDQITRVWIGESSSFDLNAISISNQKMWEPLR